MVTVGFYNPYYLWSWEIKKNKIYALNNGMTFVYKNFNGGNITVDINGNKGPNQSGKDVFSFVISKDDNQLKPLAGHCNKTYDPAGSGMYTGAGCSSAIIKNSYKFPQNYPW